MNLSIYSIYACKRRRKYIDDTASTTIILIPANGSGSSASRSVLGKVDAATVSVVAAAVAVVEDVDAAVEVAAVGVTLTCVASDDALPERSTAFTV